MIGLLTLAAVALAVALYRVSARLRTLEQRIAMLEPRFDEPEIFVRPPATITAPTPPPPGEVAARRADGGGISDELEQPEPEPIKPQAPPAPLHQRLESLIGGRLPIWIGGAALILAAFFLVRYSIERGLLGPAGRCVLGGIFGLLLLAASEFARRLPATASDSRIGQALAGAGIAILYGTLYMASELYGLVGALAAFMLMVAITIAALALALRHGPPTALMGLIGGFAAPLVTGVEVNAVTPLLVYLAIFTAGLFALAIHRGWLWLALAASAGGLAWPLFLIAVVPASQLGGIGLFVITLAFAATLALPRAGASPTPLRIAPLLVGLVQLVLIAPAMEFSALAWGLYGLLAAAALWLGWRDPRLIGGAAAATALMLVLLAIALLGPAAHAIAAALGFALLFGGAGHALARRVHNQLAWTSIALAGSALPLLLMVGLAPHLLTDTARAALALAAAIPCGWLSWRNRDRASADGAFDLGLVGGAGVAALLVAVAAMQLIDLDYLPSVIFAVAIGLTGWAAALPDRTLGRLALAALVAAVLPGLIDFAAVLGMSLIRDPLPWRAAPPIGTVLRELALPGSFVAGMLALRPALWPEPERRIAAALAATLLGATLYALAKQPLAIVTIERFREAGFVERAIITQALFAASFLLRHRLPRIALALLAVAVARVVWFDLLLLNPVLVAQETWYLAPIHLLAVSLWLGHAAPRSPWPRPLRLASLATDVLCVLVAVRQLVHGSRLDAPAITVTENYLYSAALLVAALVWLVRGITTRARDLRLAGLGLLTLVTLKVFLIDAAALAGILRILSFLALGLALIAIGWAYGRFLARPVESAQGSR